MLYMRVFTLIQNLPKVVVLKTQKNQNEKLEVWMENQNFETGSTCSDLTQQNLYIYVVWNIKNILWGKLFSLNKCFLDCVVS